MADVKGAPKPADFSVVKKIEIPLDDTRDPLGGVEGAGPTQYQFDNIRIADADGDGKASGGDKYLLVNESGKVLQKLDAVAGQKRLGTILHDKYKIGHPLLAKLPDVYAFAKEVKKVNELMDTAVYQLTPRENDPSSGRVAKNVVEGLKEALQASRKAAKKMGKEAAGKDADQFLASAQKFIKKHPAV